MLGLNETATLYRRTGVRAGKPVYAGEGISFPCRTERAHSRAAGARGQEGALSAKVFAQGVEAAPGDRVEVADGSTAVITRAEPARGRSGVHHVVLTAEGAGDHG